MKYFIVYLSSASKLEVEVFEKFENGINRKSELNAQMIPARLIAGTDLSTDLAQEAHRVELKAHQVEVAGPEDVEVTDAVSTEESLEVEIAKATDGVVPHVQTLPESDVAQEEVSSDTVAKVHPETNTTVAASH